MNKDVTYTDNGILFGHTKWRRKWQPTPVFMLGESGYPSWGHKESDKTEMTAHMQKEVLQFALTYIKLEDIMSSAISQAEKDKYWMISFICRT